MQIDPLTQNTATLMAKATSSARAVSMNAKRQPSCEKGRGGGGGEDEGEDGRRRRGWEVQGLMWHTIGT